MLSYYERRLEEVTAQGLRRLAELRACGASPATLRNDLELQRCCEAYRLYSVPVEDERFEREFPPVDWARGGVGGNAL